jgi:ferredoxin-NADP reductase
VESFRFVLTEKLNFSPGQFLRVVFDEENKDNGGLNKYLSLSCSPEREYIEVTKRLSNSSFSSRLRDLRIDDQVLIKAPLGTCVFKDDYKRIGFLIGGIGITPVISIIEYIVNRKLDTDVILVYSNRTEAEIAFKPELDSWKSINKNLKIHYLVSDCLPQDKTCIYGVINKDLLKEKVYDLSDMIFFIFGPPKMVEAMTGLASDLGCIRDNIKTESFIGY